MSQKVSRRWSLKRGCNAAEGRRNRANGTYDASKSRTMANGQVKKTNDFKSREPAGRSTKRVCSSKMSMVTAGCSPRSDDTALSTTVSGDTNPNHGPIGGPVVSQVIGKEGGMLEVYGHRMKVPGGALPGNTTVELGLVWNDDLRPQLQPGDCQMSAILSCEPSGVDFKEPVSLSLPHALKMTRSQLRRLQPALYISLQRDDGKPVWERQVMDRRKFTLREHVMEVTVTHFCYFMWTLQDGSEIEAKKVRIEMYASPTRVEEEQDIRLYVIDDIEATKEKIKHEEKELGGKVLSPSYPYVFLKNFKDFLVKITWCSSGWNPDKTTIEIPFKEMWSFDCNPRKLHFQPGDFEYSPMEFHLLKEPQKLKFRMDMLQEGNDSILRDLIISNEPQKNMASSEKVKK